MKEYRIQAIDKFRGLSISYMIFGHTIIFWLRPEDQWLRLIIFVTCEVIGANLFILLAGVGLVFSFRSQQRKITANQDNNSIQAIIQFMMPILWLLLIAFSMNIIGSTILGRPSLWIWNVLLTIAIARLICYPFLKISPWYRVAIGSCFFLLADPLHYLLSSASYFILFSTSFDIVIQNPPFPFFGFFFMGSALGDWLDNMRTQPEKLENATNQFLPRNLGLIGLVLIIISITSGFQSSTEGISFNFFSNLNVYIKLLLEGLPIFLIRGTGFWSFYSLGIELLILALFLQVDIHNFYKKLRLGDLEKRLPKDIKHSVKGLTIFGQTSLTLYVLHYCVYFIFSNSLTFQEYLIAFMIFFLGIYIGMWIWTNRGRGIGTIEWIIQYYTQLAIKNYSLKRNQK